MIPTTDHLLRVANMLESGEIPAGRFNMNVVADADECGSIHCIGGWAYTLANPTAGADETRDYVFRQTGGLNDLYFPGTPRAWSASPAQAAQAIRNYIAFGEPRWFDALEDAQ